MMDFERICLRCMKEKESADAVCSYCGADPHTYKHPVYALAPLTILDGKYMTGAVLGAGGFGITYIALDLRLNHPVAIKEYFVRGTAYRDGTSSATVTISEHDESLTEIYQANRRKFIEEAQTLAKVEDLPGIVHVHDFFEENHTAYIVMEYLPGPSLKNYVKQRSVIGWEEAVYILTPVMESMAQLHERGILHRDVAPDNLMFNASGQLKLLDFGGAKLDMQEAQDQRSSIILSKKGYTPVEQMVSGHRLGPWTDVYAMAATLFFCLSGTTPPDSMDRLYHGVPFDINRYGLPLTEIQKMALMHALEVRPENRTQSMGDLLNELHGAIHYAPPVPPVDPPLPHEPYEEDAEENHTGMIIAIAVTIVLLLCGVGALLFVNHKERSRERAQTETTSQRDATGETKAPADTTAQTETQSAITIMTETQAVITIEDEQTPLPQPETNAQAETQPQVQILSDSSTPPYEIGSYSYQALSDSDKKGAFTGTYQQSPCGFWYYAPTGWTKSPVTNESIAAGTEAEWTDPSTGCRVSVYAGPTSYPQTMDGITNYLKSNGFRITNYWVSNDGVWSVQYDSTSTGERMNAFPSLNGSGKVVTIDVACKDHTYRDAVFYDIMASLQP